jgi:hypothetical protein
MILLTVLISDAKALSHFFARLRSLRLSAISASNRRSCKLTAAPEPTPQHLRLKAWYSDPGRLVCRLFQAAVALSQVVAQEPRLLATAGWLVLGDVEATVADDGGGPCLAGLEKAVF